ncbi:phenylalanine--tRNA ligase subunit beta [Candidatus Pacearchaeota archaeon]|nr:phenylalanine--tRNA ligase subunit beta [Candidatus Pacearchaeota archaeon]
MAKVVFTKEKLGKQLALTPKAIEEIQQIGIPAELTEEGVEVEALANRPDLYSLQGFVRTVKLYQGKIKPKEYPVTKPEKTHRIIIKPDVEEIRPHTVGALIKNMTITQEVLETLIDIQEKMHKTIGRKRKKCAIGIYPAEKIAFPLTFTAKKPKEITFTPLGATKACTAEEILTTHQTGKEYAHLLEKAPRYPLFIDATGTILSMPPIINSAETGQVTLTTKELFIECSGMHLQTLNKVLALLTTLCVELGGTVQGIQIERGKETFITPTLSYTKHPFSLERANTLLGTKITEKELPKLCEKMGHRYDKGTIEYPPWRTDIMHEVDLIEDLAIAYGYEKITPEVPSFATTGSESPQRRQEQKISSLLIGTGFQEIMTYHAITEEEKKRYHLKALALEGAKTEYKYLRPNLLIPALRVYHENKDVSYPQNLYEIGTVSDEKGTERTHILVTYSPGTITHIQQLFNYLSEQLQFPLTLKQAPLPLCIPGRSAFIMHAKKEIGYIGEIHPSTLKNAGLKMPLAVLEIDITDLISKK